LWQEPHRLESGWVAAQDTPGWWWHEAHPTVRLWPDGAAWQDEQDELPGWENAQLTPGFVWHVAHAPERCPAGAVWQLAHAVDAWA
jgi:hypothetical protein